MGSLFTAFLAAGLHLAAFAEIPASLRLANRPAGFDISQSTVLGAWIAADGLMNPANFELSLSFSPGQGRRESLDLYMQARINTLRAIGNFAYYDPDAAEKLLGFLDSIVLPYKANPNMFTYAADLAALELESLFMQAFGIKSTPSLRLFIMSLFMPQFMALSLEDVIQAFKTAIAAGTDESNGSYGDQYSTLRTYSEVSKFIDDQFAQLKLYTSKVYVNDTSNTVATTNTHTPEKLTVDFKAFRCYTYESASHADDDLEWRIFNGLDLGWIGGPEFSNPSDYVRVYFDFRTRAYQDGGDPLAGPYAAIENLETLSETLQYSKISFPLPGKRTPADKQITSGSDKNYPRVVCMDKVNDGAGAERWRVRYVVVPMRWETSGADSLSGDKDSDLRRVLKRILERTREMTDAKTVHLTAYLSTPDPLWAADATAELAAMRMENVDASRVRWEMIHARRSADSAPSGSSRDASGDSNQNSEPFYNAIGYQMNVESVFVDLKN